MKGSLFVGYSWFNFLCNSIFLPLFIQIREAMGPLDPEVNKDCMEKKETKVPEVFKAHQDLEGCRLVTFWK